MLGAQNCSNELYINISILEYNKEADGCNDEGSVADRLINLRVGYLVCRIGMYTAGDCAGDEKDTRIRG